MSLFQENGYDATTVSDIADAADYSIRSFYRHFASKEAVVLFHLNSILEDVADATSQASSVGSTWVAIRNSIISSVDRFLDTDGECATAILRLWITDPSLAGTVHRFCDRWSQILVDGWSAFQNDSGSDSDLRAQQVAHCVVGTFQACVRIHVNTGRDLHELLIQAFDNLEAGPLGTGR